MELIGIQPEHRPAHNFILINEIVAAFLSDGRIICGCARRTGINVEQGFCAKQAVDPCGLGCHNRSDRSGLRMSRSTDQVRDNTQCKHAQFDAFKACCNFRISDRSRGRFIVSNVHFLGRVALSVSQQFDYQILTIVVGAVIRVLDIRITRTACGLDHKRCIVDCLNRQHRLMIRYGDVRCRNRFFHTGRIKDIAENDRLTAE